MALKVKAKEREMKVGKYAGTYRYVMLPELYSALTQEKVIREAALRSGVSEGVMHACWDAAGEVIKAPQLSAARTGYDALRPECEDGGRRERGEVVAHHHAPHRVHPRHGVEGRVEEHERDHHLLLP